jgi:hypothetical protein
MRAGYFEARRALFQEIRPNDTSEMYVLIFLHI